MICRRLIGAVLLQQLRRTAVAGLMLGVIAVAGGNTATAQIYFSEDFEGVTLEPYVDEIPPDDNPRDQVWSPNGPAGWSVNRSGVPDGGVTEWRGWNFVDPVWWNEVAGQDRANFALPEQGFVVAVADGDEWLDAGAAGDTMVSFMSTPAISLAGVASGTSISFDSSWRAEDFQYGTLSASFDGGAPVELLRLDSDANSDNYYPDENPGLIDVSVNIPNGAQNVVFSWGYSGSDDWWWAVDNISFGSYFEDFESVDLGTNVMEGRIQDLFDPDAVFTHNGPDGWTINNDGVPFYEDEGIGVTEWKGWSFANKDFWRLVAGDQNRSFFTKGEGTVAIADPDEWDDLGNPTVGETYNTILTTPGFDIGGAAAGTLTLALDSSWRPECCDDEPVDNSQTAVIEVSYDGGATFSEVLRWDSTDGSPFFHGDSENESLALALNNPAGATSAMLRFSLLEAENDWWWAIDNLVVSGAGGGKLGDFNNDGVLDATDIDDLTAQAAGGTNPSAYDLTGDNKVDSKDIAEWIRSDAIFKSYIGDANLDKEFNSSDLVTLFAAGTYENGQASKWTSGDFDGDGLFTTSDLVAALQDGGYEKGTRGAVSAVPEPSSMVLTILGALSALGIVRRRA